MPCYSAAYVSILSPEDPFFERELRRPCEFAHSLSASPYSARRRFGAKSWVVIYVMHSVQLQQEVRAEALQQERIECSLTN